MDLSKAPRERACVANIQSSESECSRAVARPRLREQPSLIAATASTSGFALRRVNASVVTEDTRADARIAEHALTIIVARNAVVVEDRTAIGYRTAIG